MSSAPNGKILVVSHNDSTDCDNDPVRILIQQWIEAVRSSSKSKYKDAIDSHIWLELKEVDPAIRRIEGTDIPWVLMPLCKVLFSEQGLVEEYDSSKKVKEENKEKMKEKIKKYLTKEDSEHFDEVLKKQRLNPSSVVIQAYLNMRIIKAVLKVIKFEDIFKKLSEIIHKDKNGKPEANGIERIHKYYPQEKGKEIDQEWVYIQLAKCVRVRHTSPKDQADLMEASTTAAMLTGHTLFKLYRQAELLNKDEKIFLDKGALRKLESPLAHHMEHPNWLVDHPRVVRAYQRTMAAKIPHSNEWRYKEMMTAMNSELESNTGAKERIIAKATYQDTIDAGKNAKRIIFFGGASMTMLASLARQDGFASKTEFAGQGGTQHPRLNLTGNAFNWDLNRSAAYKVLMDHVKGIHRLRSFRLATTELCKHITYDPIEVANLAGDGAQLLLDRLAAYGLDKYRVNPEDSILNPKNNAAELEEHCKNTKDGKIRGIPLPDLTAYFAVYSPKFQAKYCDVEQPEYMYIIKDPDTSRGDKVKRVRFSKDKNEEGPHDGEEPVPTGRSITIYLPQGDKWVPKVGPVIEKRVTGLDVFVRDCIDEHKKNVVKILG